MADITDKQRKCDHKFVDSTSCLKCGWTPTPEDIAAIAESAAQARYVGAMTKLTNWGGLMAGRITGVMGAYAADPRAAGFRDLFDRLLVLRADCDALTGLLLIKGVCTEAELREAIGMEAERLANEFAERFSGFSSSETSHGLTIIDADAANKTMKGWPQ